MRLVTLTVASRDFYRRGTMGRALAAVWIFASLMWHSTVARGDAAEVEALIAKGNDLRRAGTPGPALPYFQKAYDLARTPRTSGQLGLAELAAGYPVEAAEHLAAALESPHDPAIAKYRAMLADALANARSQVGELVVAGSPAGAEVVIDGRSVGVLPLPAAVKLAARNAEVVVRAPGYSQRREIVTIGGGERQQLTANLETINTSAPVAPIVTADAGATTIPMPVASSSELAGLERRTARDGSLGPGLRTAAWVVGGAAVVAAGAGLALNLAVRSDNDYDTWQTHRRWSIVGYTSGAALAVSSIILFWTSRPSLMVSGAHALLPCAPTASGFLCQKSF